MTRISMTTGSSELFVLCESSRMRKKGAPLASLSVESESKNSSEQFTTVPCQSNAKADLCEDCDKKIEQRLETRPPSEKASSREIAGSNQQRLIQ